MNDTNSSIPLKFYVTKSGFGFEEGIYTQEEIQSLPSEARKYVISLAVAESMGLVELKHESGKTLNELTAFVTPDPETGKIRKAPRGVAEKDTEENSPLPEKLENKLREKIQSLKKETFENSLKNQIAQKKKSLNNKPQV